MLPLIQQEKVALKSILFYFPIVEGQISKFSTFHLSFLI